MFTWLGRNMGKMARVTVAVCLLAYLAMLFVASNPHVRHWLAKEVAERLTEELGATVEIGDVEIGLFNRLVLSNVVLEDQQGEKMLRAERLGAKLSLRSLVQPKLDIRSIQILDANIRLYKTATDKAPNFQFLIDKFASKDKDSKMRPLRIGSVILRRVCLSWDLYDAKDTPGKFNSDHLRFENINASMGFAHISEDSIQMRLRELSLHEQSGLNISSLSLKLESRNESLHISNLKLQMPQSEIEQPDLYLNFSKDESGQIPLKLSADIKNWRIATSDVAFIVPELKRMDRGIEISANVRMQPDNVSLKNLLLHEWNDGMLVRGDIEMQLPKGKKPQVQAKLGELKCRNSLSKDVMRTLGINNVPKELVALGDVSYSGIITYGADRLRSVGKLSTAAGMADGLVAWNGKSVEADILAKNLNLALVTGRNDIPTDVSAKIRGRLDNLKGALPDFDGKVLLEHMNWKGQTFENISLEGGIQTEKLRVNLLANDPKARCKALLSGDIKNMTDIKVDADIYHIGGLNVLPEKLRNSTFAGHISIDMPQLKSNALNGSLELRDANICRLGECLKLEKLSLKVVPQNDDEGLLTLNSDFADIEIEGPMKPQLLINTAKEIGLQALGMSDGDVLRKNFNEKAWRINASITSSEELKHFFDLPVDFKGPLTIHGDMRADGGKTSLTTAVKEFSIGSFAIKDANIFIGGASDSLSVLAQVAKEMDSQDIKIDAGIKAKNGDLTANVKWAGNGTELLHGSLQTKSKLYNINGDKILVSRFIPSSIVIGDTIWNVESDQISYGKGVLDISGFSLSHDDQSVRVAGRLSPDVTDSIKVMLNKVNIAYILNLVEFDDVSFDGEATGLVSVDRTGGYPKFSGRLDVPNFLFNDAPMGRLDFIGGFDIKEKRLDLSGYMTPGNGDFTDVKGYVSLLNKELDLNIESRNTNLSFLQRFVGGIFSNFQGKATGHCHLYGPFKALDFEGEELADASATIDAIGVNYQLSGGKVKIKPGEFAFSNFSVSDGMSGSGTASGHLRHTHLKNINFDFNMEADKLLIYDKRKELDMPFYATAFGTGSMLLRGKPGEFEADVNMRPERGTVFTYTVDAPETFGDVKMVSYRDKSFKLKEGEKSEHKEETRTEEATTDIRLNMLFDVTPDATLKIIMNEKTGDNITVRGEGPIRANFYNKGPFRMYGVFNIDEGNYRMNIQDFIRKDFQLAHGGTISFNGDPYQGDLDMQAIYTVKSASLSDLNIGTGLSQNSVRVNCLLNFSGKVKNPQVSFDLDLPTVHEEEKQLVRNIISTEEDMNMQIIYLLGIGRFYTYATPQDGTSLAGSQSAAAMKSFLSSTLSGQLNEIISNAVGMSNWSFGTNVSTGGADTNEFEVEGQLSGKLLSGRLLINGNIGYRDKSIYNNSSFIGDFDVQYLLTPKGSVRLKAYSETNERYFTKSSLTTQGIGIQLSRDFTNLRELFGVKGRKKKKKQDDSSPKQ